MNTVGVFTEHLRQAGFGPAEVVIALEALYLYEQAGSLTVFDDPVEAADDTLTFRGAL